MEELMSIGTNIATLIAIGVAVVSGIIVAFAGFQYATAGGDPQKVGIAKASFIGAFIGLIIASLAFIGPRIVTDMVIKPVGGVALDTQVGLNCDSVLRSQLVFQRGASTKDRIQVVISQIQSQQQACAKDVWDPEAIDMDEGGLCYSAQPGKLFPAIVGDQDLPEGLTRQRGDRTIGRLTSGRDSENNIIVYWSNTEAKRPSDAASCWLYYSRLRSWHENFFQMSSPSAPPDTETPPDP